MHKVLPRRLRNPFSYHHFFRGCCCSLGIVLCLMSAAYLLSLSVHGEETPPQTETETITDNPSQQRDSSKELEEPPSSSLSLNDFRAAWSEEEGEAVFTAVLSTTISEPVEVAVILPSLSKEEMILGRDTLASYEAEGLEEGENWECEVLEEEQRKALFTLQSETSLEETSETLRTLTLTIHARPDDNWKRYLSAHPGEEDVRKQEAILIAGNKDNEIYAAAKTYMTSSAKRSGSSDEGLARKRPDTVTFDLFRRESDGSLTPMGEDYRKTVSVEGEEQTVIWKDLPSGDYLIRELPVEGYSVREEIEEYKDSELHVFINSIENSTVLHLSKQITDSNSLPIRKDACIHLILETYEQKINENGVHKIGEETLTLFTENGSLEWDSDPLPLSSSDGEYFYKLRETDTEGYEVYYAWNDEVYTGAQWESSSLGLMRNGTLTITNQEKISEYRLPSTGGPGKEIPLLLPILLILITSLFRLFTLRKDPRE